MCVNGRWAGVDCAWEQRKLEAKKVCAERGAKSHMPKRSEGVHAVLGGVCTRPLLELLVGNVPIILAHQLSRGDELDAIGPPSTEIFCLSE